MGDLLSCPFCGADMQIEGEGYEHPPSDTCPLDSLYIEDRHIPAWNTRALPAASPADGAEAPAHAEPVAWVNMADWSDLPDVYVTKAECQQGMFWRIEACSVPMAIGPEVRLIRADKMLAHPPTDAAEIEQLRYIAAANQDRAEKAEAERDAALARAEKAEAERDAALARAEKAEAERDRWEDACHIAQQKYFEMVAERDAALARVAELEAALTPLPDAELDALRDEAYDATEKAARYYGPNGYIAHTWTKKSAFFAGWDAALRIRPVGVMWQPIETAPRDRVVLVYYDHDADPYQDTGNPNRLTDYAAWAEGGDFLDGKGICLAKWFPSHWETVDEYGSGYRLPAWWFAAEMDDFERVVNPTHWMPLPEPPALTPNTAQEEG